MKNQTTKQSKKSILIEYLFLALGTLVMAFALELFIAPQNLVLGGVTGLGIIILHYSAAWPFQIPVWLTNLVINIPLLLVGLKIFGMEFIFKTIFCTLFLSLSLFVLEISPIYLDSDLFLSSIFGGMMTGVGLGIVLRFMATTGGTDLAATILHRFFPSIAVSRLLMFLDWAVILTGFFVFGSSHTMYALIAIFIATKAIDYVLEGLNFAKVAFIISSTPQEIGRRVLTEMDRGVTALNGYGMYTGESKDILMCVMSKKEITRLKRIVASVDASAFVILTDVREVFGEGFTTIKTGK